MTDADKIIAACCVEELDEIHEELARFHARGDWAVIGDLLPRLRRVREQLCCDEDSIPIRTSHLVPFGVVVALGPNDETGDLEVKGLLTQLG